MNRRTSTTASRTVANGAAAALKLTLRMRSREAEVGLRLISRIILSTTAAASRRSSALWSVINLRLLRDTIPQCTKTKIVVTLLASGPSVAI